MGNEAYILYVRVHAHYMLHLLTQKQRTKFLREIHSPPAPMTAIIARAFFRTMQKSFSS